MEGVSNGSTSPMPQAPKITQVLHDPIKDVVCVFYLDGKYRELRNFSQLKVHLQPYFQSEQRPDRPERTDRPGHPERRISELEASLKSSEQGIRDLVREKADIQKSLDASIAEISACRADIARQRKIIADLEHNNTELEQRNEDLEQRNEELNRRNKERIDALVRQTRSDGH